MVSLLELLHPASTLNQIFTIIAFVLIFNTGAVNNFVQVSFDNKHVNCTFINQPKENRKFCYVTYGPVTSDCTDRPYSMDGYINDANSIALKFIDGIDDSEICFLVTASTSTATVNVEGTGKIILFIMILQYVYYVHK